MEHRTDEAVRSRRRRGRGRCLALTGSATRAASTAHARIRDIADQLALGYAVDLRVLLHTVVPVERDGRHGAAGRELEFDRRALREHEVADAFLLDALYTGWSAELQRHVRSAKNVAG